MADADWLKFSSNDNATQTATDVELTFPHSSQEIECDYDYNDRSAPSGGGSCSGRKICAGIVVTVLLIGAVVGASLGVLLSQDKQSSSGSETSSNVHNAVPVPTTNNYAWKPTASPGPTPSNANEIAELIDNLARGNELQDPSSYQSRAKRWVLTQHFPVPDGSSMSIEQQASQLYGLACIYYATFGVRSEWTDIHFGRDVDIPGWFSSRGWLGTAIDVCSNWHGLSCNGEGRVTKIELDTNGLTGSFPPETALLHETLNTIDLYNNLLHNAGDEGNSFLGELTNLEHLYIGTTSFEYDGVPSELGKLTALSELDFSYSLYYGNLDGAAFANLTNLKYLVMDGNVYNSSLPSELIQLPELEYLYAGYSFLEGGLDFVSSMPKIFELWMDDNPGLKGTIPATIGNSPNLASFSASNCGLVGSIPTEIGMMTGMIQMWLNDNDLTGEIPTEIGNLVTMKILNLQNNKLMGDMPSNICSRRRPFGRLEDLGADCYDSITCDEECCTCCGAQCTHL